MLKPPTHEVTFWLDTGSVMTTEVVIEPEDIENSPLEDFIDYLENDREGGNWKVAEDMAAFHRRIVGVRIREL